MKIMWERGDIDKCPVCHRYHKADKPDFPMANIYLCEKCKKERNTNKQIVAEWLKNE